MSKQIVVVISIFNGYIVFLYKLLSIYKLFRVDFGKKGGCVVIIIFKVRDKKSKFGELLSLI